MRNYRRCHITLPSAIPRRLDIDGREGLLASSPGGEGGDTGACWEVGVEYEYSKRLCCAMEYPVDITADEFG
jgi:hypothetical protein